MAEILLRLTSVLPQLHNLNNTPDERYDSEIRDLVAYIKQFDRNLVSQDLLDVSTAGILWLTGNRITRRGLKSIQVVLTNMVTLIESQSVTTHIILFIHSQLPN